MRRAERPSIVAQAARKMRGHGKTQAAAPRHGTFLLLGLNSNPSARAPSTCALSVSVADISQWDSGERALGEP